ncbi:MAG: energy-coupling factor ABC transporter ATP-binding protein [Synergistaceae bacterium]|jgi:cobalt/nickel transport system ATP-binding protein|nr:energy-coupling factor ABC transporter ATP-binding protein [Synergistaceae bacterium]
MLHVKNLSVTYPDGHKALSDVTFTLHDGERVALIGANGAGKSSLIRAIMGLLPISDGEVAVDGISLSKRTARDIRRMVGVVFQNPDDQLFMTRVYDDVAFGPRNMGLSEDAVAERVNSALAQLDISRLKDRMSDRLSVGEKRMAGIASVLSMSPGALLLDEPSSSLDPRARRILITTLRSLPQAALIATHDLDLVKRLCTRVIVLQDGMLSAEGNSDDILFDEKKLEQFGL